MSRNSIAAHMLLATTSLLSAMAAFGQQSSPPVEPPPPPAQSVDTAPRAPNAAVAQESSPSFKTSLSPRAGPQRISSRPRLQ